MTDVLADVANCLYSAERILFITGAGLSADSGLPTYRGIGGLYEGQYTSEGIPIEVALSRTMLGLRPDITWKYLSQIGSACLGATFNRAHEVIAAIERWKPDTWVLTQNVDGLHHAAGTQNLVEVHGRVAELYCMECSYRTTSDGLGASYDTSDVPACPACGGLIRPNVVLFEEPLPPKALDGIEKLTKMRKDLVVVVGTSGAFPYITHPVAAAKLTGVPIVEINPCVTKFSKLVDYHIQSRAAEAFDRLWEIIQSGQFRA